MLDRLDLSASSEATSSIYYFSMISMAVLRSYIALVAKVLIRPADPSITRRAEP
jgi:hypothetical protein